MLTAEGRTPPSAEYKANLPTGIPIPWITDSIVKSCVSIISWWIIRS